MELTAFPGLEHHFDGQEETLAVLLELAHNLRMGHRRGPGEAGAAAKRAARPTVWHSERDGGRVPGEDNLTWKKRSIPAWNNNTLSLDSVPWKGYRPAGQDR